MYAATMPYNVPDSQAASNRLARAASSTLSAECSGIGTTHAGARVAHRLPVLAGVRLALVHASGSSGAFLAGIEKFGVRWNTVRCSACSAMSGIDWIPDEPVPTTPTR